LVSGHALVSDRQVGPGGRRDILVVFHGAGTLSSELAESVPTG